MAYCYKLHHMYPELWAQNVFDPGVIWKSLLHIWNMNKYFLSHFMVHVFTYSNWTHKKIKHLIG